MLKNSKYIRKEVKSRQRKEKVLARSVKKRGGLSVVLEGGRDYGTDDKGARKEGGGCGGGEGFSKILNTNNLKGGGEG